MYTVDEKVIIYLSQFEFLTYEKMDKLIFNLGTPERLIHRIIEEKSTFLKIISSEEYDIIYNNLSNENLRNYLKILENNNITCITIYSDNYPEKLKNIDNPPYILYCKGDLELLNTPSIAIVGSRKPTDYGERVTKEFTKELSTNGLTVVSGLAYGIDRIANEEALNNGKTIAVLGGGLNHIYPSINTNLANKIAEKGLLVSEYAFDIKPKSYYFPFRNRIIAGLADSVLITEASEKSGSMHTKEYALDAGKEVFAIPGNIYSENSKGTNKLIQTAQCCCVLSSKDILDYYNIDINKNHNNNKKIILNEEENKIIKILKNGDKHFEELLALTKLDTKSLNTCLTSLVIRGIIKKLSGNFYTI